MERRCSAVAIVLVALLTLRAAHATLDGELEELESWDDLQEAVVEKAKGKEVQGVKQVPYIIPMGVIPMVKTGYNTGPHELASAGGGDASDNVIGYRIVKAKDGEKGGGYATQCDGVTGTTTAIPTGNLTLCRQTCQACLRCSGFVHDTKAQKCTYLSRINLEPRKWANGTLIPDGPDPNTYVACDDGYQSAPDGKSCVKCPDGSPSTLGVQCKVFRWHAPPIPLHHYVCGTSQSSYILVELSHSHLTSYLLPLVLQKCIPGFRAASP